MQSASTVFMVRPASFAFNPETAVSNHFQQALAGLSAQQAQMQALAEFDAAVAKLRSHGVEVRVIEDTLAPAKPDAVFPNNWVSLHPDGTVVLYPMCAHNRRLERRADVVEALSQAFRVTQVIDLSSYEQEGRYLEGTGSIIFDHTNRVAYACLSPRTDAGLLTELARQLGYRAVLFRAQDAKGQPIYHTNVMMCVASAVAVVCLECIADQGERAEVVAALQNTGHRVVDISLCQVASFSGNMLALRSGQGVELLVMSESALRALTPQQKFALEEHCELVSLAIPTIETLGGGSARCMLAEVLLPRREL